MRMYSTLVTVLLKWLVRWIVCFMLYHSFLKSVWKWPQWASPGDGRFEMSWSFDPSFLLHVFISLWFCCCCFSQFCWAPTRRRPLSLEDLCVSVSFLRHLLFGLFLQLHELPFLRVMDFRSPLPLPLQRGCDCLELPASLLSQASR